MSILLLFLEQIVLIFTDLLNCILNLIFSKKSFHYKLRKQL